MEKVAFQLGLERCVGDDGKRPYAKSKEYQKQRHNDNAFGRNAKGRNNDNTYRDTQRHVHIMWLGKCTQRKELADG